VQRLGQPLSENSIARTRLMKKLFTSIVPLRGGQSPRRFHAPSEICRRVSVFKGFPPPQCSAGAGDLRGGVRRRLTFSEAESSHSLRAT